MMPVRSETLIPLAITLDTDGGACVSGLTPDGRWLRPEPLTATDVMSRDTPYHYFQPVRMGLSSIVGNDARPEDRKIEVPAVAAGPVLCGAARQALVAAHADTTVTETFGGLRSIGLLRVQIRRLYGRRATGGKTFLRMNFTDPARDTYDWIVRDVRLLRAFPDPLGEPEAAALSELRDHLVTGPVYVAIGLTKPNGRFPGKFRGCHPVIVGVLGATEYWPGHERGATDAFSIA